jgi:GT2 family glycosyltransferase
MSGGGEDEGIGLVGVVVIGRNEGMRLHRCLASITRETTRAVYVDSGSTDGSVELARDFGTEVVTLDLSRPFTAARARNAGIDRLLEKWPNVEHIQTVDGDCEFVEGWLRLASDYLSGSSRCGVVCGRLRERHPDQSRYNRLCDLEWDAEPGIVKSCGGIAMYRKGAITESGGFRDTMIAGEEPELCVRLRNAGWKVHRLSTGMAWHDAGMTRFSQFWKRAKRAGHAYAEGAALHGRGPDRHGVRAVRSALVWGLGLPVLAAVLAFPTLGVSVLVLAALFGLQGWRIRAKERARGRSSADASLVAVAVMIAKFAQVAGIFLYWRRRLLGQRSSLIEYKGPAAIPAAERSHG